MFEELSLLGGPRVLYVPAMCVTLWSLHGILWRGWSVGEMFFWAWCEMMLAGAFSLLLLYRWHRMAQRATWQAALKEVAKTALALFFMGFMATMFTLIAWGAEFGKIVNLPPFLHERRISLALCVTGFALAHIVIARSSRFTQLVADDVLRPLVAKMVPMLGLYAVMIFQYHSTGSKTLDVSRSYLLLMGGALLGCKLLWELRCLTRRGG